MFFSLMHKDDVVALLKMGADFRYVQKVQIVNQELTPYLGKAMPEDIEKWIYDRAVPTHRSEIQTILKRNGCRTPAEFLYKNLALSMTDSYWVKPAGSGLRWEDVNLYDNGETEIGFGHESSMKALWKNGTHRISPNSSLGGQMRKHIDLSGKFPVLVKQTKEYYGLQCFNEVIASDFHRLQGKETDTDYVRYSAERNPVTGAGESRCRLFTDKEVEFVPAWEVIHFSKKPNDVSFYDFYANICEKLGIEHSSEFMDYMTVSDFALSNTDRHLNNFGVLRNADTMKIFAMAPLFDTGNSMFYTESVSFPMTKNAIMKMQTSGFYTKSARWLSRVKNRNAVDISKMPTAESIREYLVNNEIPKTAAKNICTNYLKKIELLEEFQIGKTPINLLGRERKTFVRLNDDFER